MRDDDPKAVLEDLFAEGFRDFPHANPTRLDSQPYALGFSAHAEIERLEAQRDAIMARVKEYSGGACGRIGFIS